MNHNNNLIKDFAIIVLSIIIAIILVKTGLIKEWLASVQEMKFIGSFIAGLFFTSFFTVAPATAVLAEAARLNSVWWVAFFGGIGALIGDLIIFRFIKNRLSEDFFYLINQSKFRKLKSAFRWKFIKWLMPFIGALVIASPLPDELGLIMMGLAKTKNSLFIPIAFLLNFSGILVIGLIAKTL
jgi:hypothetical protein